MQAFHSGDLWRSRRRLLWLVAKIVPVWGSGIRFVGHVLLVGASRVSAECVSIAGLCVGNAFREYSGQIVFLFWNYSASESDPLRNGFQCEI